MAKKETRAINADQFREVAQRIKEQLGAVIVGQEQLVHELLITILAGGNALLEGVPGLGKTLLVRTLADIFDVSFNRIQFTPDLMPADIIGSVIIVSTDDGDRGFRFEPGPIFASLVLADEINRAAPRTQSALLEAMQERHVTVSGTTYDLPQPFFVLATQNPLEMEGTYPLPEAQLDRFMYKLHVPYPSEEELVEIARRTTGAAMPQVSKVANGAVLLSMQHLAKQVPVADNVFRYIAQIVIATHPDDEEALDSVQRHLRVGVSPRGVQAITWAAKVEALLDNRKAVSIDDVQRVIFPALRHRLLLNYEAQMDGVVADEILLDVVDQMPIP